MKLDRIIKVLEVLETSGSSDRQIDSITFDSRSATADSLFFATVGTAVDGHNYIDAAIYRGAVAVVCQTMPAVLRDSVCYLRVADSQQAVALASAEFYDNPSRKLHLVGVTGTNGKTTIATLLYDLFRRLGYKAGLLSTVVYKIDNRSIASTHTTPDAIRINQMLAEMVDVGCEYCFMEVSSHSLVQQRVAGLHFEGALFTNLTHDHFDYHKTFAEYLKAKKRLFDMLPKEAFAVINLDDRNGNVMVQNCRAERITGYSLYGRGRWNGKVLEESFEGMLLEIDSRQLWVRLVGKFNASNLLCIYAAAVELGADRDEVLKELSMLSAVSGRFETLRSGDGVTAIIDYAHTPDALSNVLDTIADVDGVNRTIVVVGCGGDRDRTKRPEMAAIAVEKASRAIFTSDNPRTEDPEAILDDMVAGVGANGNYVRIADRSSAIRTALMMAERGDVVLVAGKGHEDYQIVGTQKHHFSDREQVEQLFAQR